MNLPQFSVRYPVTVAMIMLAIGILGVISFQRLGTDLLPAMYNPRLVVELQSGERSPQEMEERYARNLEGALGTVSRVAEVHSVCSVGRVLVTVTFSWGTDMDFALLDVQKKIAGYESDPEVTRLDISRYDPQEEPIMIFALSSRGERDLDELRRLGENLVKRNLERLEGVARVQVYGGHRREVRVELDDYLLDAHRLTPAEVVAKIRQANANASGGRLVQDDKAYLIKGLGSFTSVEDVGRTVVGYKAGAASGDSAVGMAQESASYAPDKVPIYLAEVATVRFAPQERSDLVQFNGRECLGLYIYKEAQDNTVLVAGQVAEVINRMQAELADCDFQLIHSQATFIQSAIGEVKTTAVIGVLLAVLVLYLFLRHWGVTLMVSLSIPISILATFTLMYFQRLTLNMMTLGGLALGAGMLVDNAIVVIENIFRRRQLGEAAEPAAVKGTAEVGVAIMASTLTTVVVFLPIVFVQGIAAELFKDQAWVVAFALLSSLLVAFLLIPALAARLMARVTLRRFLPARGYPGLLRWALQNGWTVIGLAVLVMAAAATLMPVVGAEFVPRSSENQVRIELTLSPGAPLDRTQAVLAGVEERVRQVLGEALHSQFATVNVRTSQSVFGAAAAPGEHQAALTLTLADRPAAARTPAAVIALLRPHLEIPDVAVSFGIRETSLQQNIGIGEAGLTLEVRGEELPTLQLVSEQAAEVLRNTPGLHSVATSFESGRPEINLRIDRLLAASFGLDVQQIGQRVRERLAGEAVSDFFSEGEDRTIRVAYPRTTLAELAALPLQTPGGALVRLRDVAVLERGEGPIEIRRHDQSRVAQVTARLDRDLTMSQAVAVAEAALAQLPLPAGYEVRFAGEEISRQESFDRLKFALLLSIVLVYMVMASLFESLLHPFTILLTLPLAGAGVVFALLLVGEPFSVMAYIGIIMLAGIAVNNAIVMVDYINRLRAGGTPLREAVLRAGGDRLRPILMTTLTTILALLPLTIGLGEGARLRAPMAVAVIGGLVTSTLLTLLVIPVVYEKVEHLRARIRR